MGGTWNFYSIFGGADTACGLLLPSPRPVFPTTEVILSSWMNGFSSQSQPCISWLFPLLPATGQCLQPHKLTGLVEKGWSGSLTVLPACCPFLPFLLLEFPCFLLWASTVDSQRHLTHLNSAPCTWLLVWAVLIFDYLLSMLSKLQLKLQRTLFKFLIISSINDVESLISIN